MNLNTKLSDIKGVGPRSFESFRTARLETVNDLIYFLPRRHEDFTTVSSIADLKPGKVTIKASVESISSRRVRRGMQLTTAVLKDASGKLNAVWFNQAYRTRQLSGTSQEFYFSGEFEYNYGRYQLTSPSAERAVDLPVQADRLMPVYPAIRGLKSQLVRKALLELRPLISVLPERLPEAILANQSLLPLPKAISQIHFPHNLAEAESARERLAFDELFELLLASQLNKQDNQKLPGYKIPFDVEIVRKFVAQLPFKLTNAQRRSAWDILQDFEKSTPMNRMLQGDVGSGKTVVAGLTMLQAAVKGYQSALMAPTDILASQHAETLEKLLSPFNITVGLLTGKLPAKAKTELQARISSGDVDVIVGTHALIQDKVKYNRLGYVVIDEQHRFGVEQRHKLLSKSGKMPHLLSMTATPIPRSLSLTVYGEMDISILDERPKERLPIITQLVSPVSRETMIASIDKELSSGHQAYVICGLIDDSFADDRKSVESEFRRIKNSQLGKYKIAKLHGKLKPAEKDQIMNDFKAKKFDILISTTVVEVGVDVPNATVIVIEDADKFGLAQLHQLRGRVGRSSLQSYCFLVLSGHDKPSRRLREIEKSNDGFHLAEVDLQIRGPGEIYGQRQSGQINLQIASLADTKLVARAKSAAVKFIKSQENLANYPDLQRQVEHYQRLTTLN